MRLILEVLRYASVITVNTLTHWVVGYGCNPKCIIFAHISFCQQVNMTEPHWWKININSLDPREFEWNFRWVIFLIIWLIYGWGILWNCPLMTVIGPCWGEVNIGSGAVRHQAFTQATAVPVLCCCMASLGHNELIQELALCHQATRQFLKPCSMILYGIPELTLKVLQHKTSDILADILILTWMCCNH